MKEETYTRQELIDFIKNKYNERESLLSTELLKDVKKTNPLLFMPKTIENMVDEIDKRGSGVFFYLVIEDTDEDDEVNIHIKSKNIIKEDDKYKFININK